MCIKSRLFPSPGWRSCSVSCSYQSAQHSRDHGRTSGAPEKTETQARRSPEPVCNVLQKLRDGYWSLALWQPRFEGVEGDRSMPSPALYTWHFWCISSAQMRYMHGSLSVVTRLTGRCFNLRFGNLHVVSSDLLITALASIHMCCSFICWCLRTVGPF